MNNIETIYPPEVGNETNKCYCCKKEKVGIYIKKDASNCDNIVWVCNNCNHLKSEDNKEI